jgi:hypothetical protein
MNVRSIGSVFFFFLTALVCLSCTGLAKIAYATETPGLQVVTNNQELLAALDSGASRIALQGQFTQILLNRSYPDVLIIAHSATVQGLRMVGAKNVKWIGGQIEASGGSEASGPSGYGLFLQNSENIHVTDVRFRNANRGIAGGGGTNNITIANSNFSLRQDGIIYAGGANVTIENNTFENFTPKPSVCTLPDGQRREGISRRDCTAQNGTWVDGDHSDAIQFRNGCENFTIAHNRIINVSQGVGQMDSPNDLPVRGFKVIGNEVQVSGFHSITFNSKPNEDILVANNTVIQTPPRKSPLRLPGDIISFGNVVVNGAS